MKSIFNIIIFVLILPISSIACTCNGVNEIKEEIKSVDIVIVATAISNEYVQIVDSSLSSSSKYIFLQKYVFVVEEQYKGRIKSDTVTIYTGPSIASCGVKFKLDEKYIIYGFKKSYYPKSMLKESPKGKNIFWAHRCTRTQPLSVEESIKIKEVLNIK